MGSLIEGILGLIACAAFILIGGFIVSAIRDGEEDGIIDHGYVGEDDDNDG
jgi:hypothetical protein